MPVTELAAIVAVLLLAAIALFQLGLALGAPWGRAAWGGQHLGVLPTRLRLLSAVAALIVYPIVILLVLASSGLVRADWLPGTGVVGMWVLTGLFALGAFLNLVSRSRLERTWGPVSLIIAVCCATIALGL